jgi:hypothetical protein
VNAGGGIEVPDLRRAPAERAAAAVLPASGLVWTAAEIMHMTGFPGTLHTGLIAGGAWLLAWGAAGRTDRVPVSLPWWVAAGGGWLTAAQALGPLHWWPAPGLTLAWAAIALTASKAAHRHESVVDAREWREEREAWLSWRSRKWGLGGSHLLDFKRTRLGELYEVSTRGTGHRASHFVGHALEEFIAEAEGDLAINRVRVMGHGFAGRIRISIRRIDPWADVLLHPLVCEEPEIQLAETRSILDEAVIGQDPETGEPLTVPLFDDNGARRVSVTANSGGGKGVLEDDLFEHVTACRDAVAVHLNLSVKGYEDEESWGPACWLTAYGPEQKSRAAAIMKIIGEVLEWRAKNFKRGRYAPSREHPAIIVFADESDAAVAAVRDGLNMIATKGRSHGVGYVHLGQRNTRDYADPKSRSQDNVFCTGVVRNATEDRHAGTGSGPSMATYGEGKPGVWKIERLGGGLQLGRTWVFHPKPAGHGAEVERIAAERAFDQPEISGACRECLGEPYEALLATEVFPRWARANGYADPEPDDDETAEPGSPVTPASPESGDGTQAAAPAARGAVLTEDDGLKGLDWEVAMTGRERDKLAALDAKLGGVRRMITQTLARPAAPEVPAEALAAQVAEHWRQVGVEAVIPDEARPRLLEMLGAGTTISAVAREFGQKKWTARTWLGRLRDEGVAYVDGERSTARWRLTPPPAEGDTQSPLNG